MSSLIVSSAFAECAGYAKGAWINNCPWSIVGHYQVVSPGCGLAVGWSGDFGPIRAGKRQADPGLLKCKLNYRWCDYGRYSSGLCTPLFGAAFKYHGF